MTKILFKDDKQLFKANMHCHTTVSDGKYTPERIKEMYKEKGYSIVAYSDHDVLINHSDLNDETFLAINSYEAAINQSLVNVPWSKSKTYHFNLFSDDPDITETPPLPDMKYEDTDAINKYIRDRSDEGFLVCYNHPYWSMQTYEDYSKLKGCFAMEIYNHGCEVTDGYYGYNPQSYDEMLRLNNKILCLSTDDNHDIESSFGGFIMISADKLNYGSIIESIKKGDYYSSQGPQIYEISLNDDILRIKCSDVCLIVVYTDSRACFNTKGESLNEAEFKLKGDEKYIRITCRDKNHKDANSNAYWL